MGFAYAPYRIWPLAILGAGQVIVLVRAMRSARSAAAYGYLFGLGYFGLTISFMKIFGWWALVATVAVTAVGGALLFYLERIVLTCRAWPLWTACCWSLVEWIWQRFPFGGFGWVRLAFSTADQPLGGYLWVGGAAFTSWVVALCASLCIWACERDRRRLIAGVGAIASIFAAGQGLRTVPIEPADDTLTLGLIQGDLTGTTGFDALGSPGSVANNHLSETITYLAKVRTGLIEEPDAIVWPENATDTDPRYDRHTADVIATAVDLARDIPLGLGTILFGPGDDERQTSSVWYDPDGTMIARYDKQNVVPFGEYLPMRSLLLRLVPMARIVGRQSVPGTEPGAIQVSMADRIVTIGPIICYELAFDSTVYDTVTHGAQVLIVQSSNGAYSGTDQPVQQFEITRIRAMELRRDIAVVTTNALSGLIDGHGVVRAVSSEQSSASTSVTLDSSDYISPAARISGTVDCGLAGIGLVVWVYARFVRTRLSKHGRSYGIAR